MRSSSRQRPRWIRSIIAAAAFVACGGETVVEASSDPQERWLHAYVLVQTGEFLGESELWPLALANFSAALQEFEDLSVDYPEFQPRLISYRREELKRRIGEANESMNAGEHGVALRYQEILESTRVAVRSRMRLDHETAYRFFSEAQWQLEALREEGAPELSAALTDQQDYLDEITESSRDLLIREPEGGLKAHNIEKDLAERLSIAVSELPSFQEIEPSASGMSSALFPDELVARVRGQWYR